MKHTLRNRLLVLNFLLLLSNLYSQSHFQKMRFILNGVGFYGGVHQTNFLNNTFATNLNTGEIKQNIGYSAGFTGVKFPLCYYFGYSQSNFEISSTSGINSIKEGLASAGISVYLFHFKSFIYPMAGVKYNYGVLGSTLLKSEADKLDFYSAKQINHLSFNFNLDIHLGKVLRLSPYYQRSIMSNINRAEYGVYLKFKGVITNIK